MTVTRAAAVTVTRHAARLLSDRHTPGPSAVTVTRATTVTVTHAPSVTISRSSNVTVTRMAAVTVT